MASKAKFPIYSGKKPYIFISYAHADSTLVLPIAEQLHNRLYRVWYDEGIEAGSNWPEIIAGRLSQASLVIFFISKNAVKSQNCNREMNFAIDQKLPMVCVYLDDAELSPGVKMQFSVVPGIHWNSNTDAAVQALLEIGACTRELVGDGVEGYEKSDGQVRKRTNGSLIVGIVGIVLAVLVGFTLLGYTQGWFGNKAGISSTAVSIPSDDASGDTTEITITKWTSSVMRDLLLSQTDSEALYCCGNTFLSSRIAITYSDGTFFAAGESVQRGDISDLSIIAKRTDLQELSLCFESITDVSALASLANLTYLDLSGNDISDISSLAGMDSLMTLKLSHTQVTDLSAVQEMASLKRLYISYDMVGYVEELLGASFEVVVTE